MKQAPRRRRKRLVLLLLLVPLLTLPLLYLVLLRPASADRLWHLSVFTPRISAGSGAVPPPGRWRWLHRIGVAAGLERERKPRVLDPDEERVQRLVRDAMAALKARGNTFADNITAKVGSQTLMDGVRMAWAVQLPGPAPSGKWAEFQGALGAGGDVLGSENGRTLSLLEARAACESDSACVGFTHLGEMRDDGSSRPVWFKKAWNLIPNLKERKDVWYSHKLEDRPAPVSPVPHPPWVDPLLRRAHQAVTAGYDLDTVVQQGLSGPLARQWPEYLRGSQSPVFDYPMPRKDMLLVSVAPRVYYLPQFVSPETADQIVESAAPKLVRSAVAKGLHEDRSAKEVDSIRTSHGAWLGDDNPAARLIRDKIANITNLPRDAFEAMQVLRYSAKSGEKYDPHWDYFPPSGYGPQSSNRIATFLTFLSDVEPGVGGETVLPRAMGRPPTEKMCQDGLRVRPTKGAGLLFYGMRRNMAFDPFSQHGGCPHNGSTPKWIAPQWLRLSLPPDGLPPESRSGWGT